MKKFSFSEEPVSPQYFGLVVHQAKKIYERLALTGGSGIELSELVQQGFLGLAEAWRNYEPCRNILFATFALPRIHGAIVDYLRHVDPLTQREREKFKKLEQTKRNLLNELCREPEVREIAQRLGVSEDEIRKRESLRIVLFSAEGLSPDSLGGDEENSTEFSVDHSNPEKHALDRFDEAEKVRLAKDMEHCLHKALDDMERSILIQRIQHELTLIELGKLWNTSKDSVARREKEAKRKMKACLENSGWETYDVISLVSG
jgi:RNA polymerase sigma factor for flagellar operon FliA